MSTVGSKFKVGDTVYYVGALGVRAGKVEEVRRYMSLPGFYYIVDDIYIDEVALFKNGNLTND